MRNFVKLVSRFFRAPPARPADPAPRPAAEPSLPAPLPARARELEKPCLLLKRTGSDKAAVWGGPGVVSAPPGPYRHWISVDCRYLPHREHIKEGVLSIYTNEDDCVTGLALFSAQATLPDEGADFLYAHRAVSLPPPDASPELDKDTYLDHWQDNCPIYHSTDVVAVLGGWHFPWPDGDWEALRERRLLVWTLADSEPWVEAWEWQGETTVMQRIT